MIASPHHPMNQHAISVAAVVVPTASFWIRAAPVITDIAGLCGIVWYVYLAGKEIYRYYKRKKT
jgi:hypothetical protein